MINQESELLFKTIENIICNSLQSIGFDRMGIIISQIEHNIFEVVIDSQIYKIKNGIGVPFIKGDKCLVHYINGSEQNKIIIAKL